jgi:hypothetical protein
MQVLIVKKWTIKFDQTSWNGKYQNQDHQKHIELSITFSQICKIILNMFN